MVRLLAVLMLAGASVNAQTVTESPEQDPIEGSWRWFNRIVVQIKADGTFTDITSNGKSKGKWKCTDFKKRRYTLQWNDGLIEDYATLSKDGKKLHMINHDKFKHTAVKIIPL